MLFDRAFFWHAFSGLPTGGALRSRLGRETYSAGGKNCGASSHRPPRRGGGLFSFAEAGIDDGRAKLPVAALPGRD